MGQLRSMLRGIAVTGDDSPAQLLAQLDAATPNRLAADLTLKKVARYPYAGVKLVAKDVAGMLAMADFSRYDRITFLARCKPAGTMSFAVTMFDEKVSKPGDFFTYPLATTFFSCNERGVPVSLDTRRMSIPDWWLYINKVNLPSLGYHLDKVVQFSFGSSSQTHFDVTTHVELSDLTLQGKDHRYLVALAVLLVGGWIAFAIWFFRTRERELATSLQSRMKKDMPLSAFRQLTDEPYPDAEKTSVLKFIATNYTDPELELDKVVAATGANRNKVNEILKSELGMTFTAYVNKLRLTEAARLLMEKPTAAVAEIAYSVGYGNVSYFNKLFKDEYNCTPRAFRSLAPQRASLPAN